VAQQNNIATLQSTKTSLDASAPSDRVAYFDAIYELAHTAAEAAGGFIDRTYSIAGLHVRLRFAGPALVSAVTTAFEHLHVSENSAQLTIYIWDTASTGKRMPPPPWEGDDFLARGVIQGYNDDRIHTAFQHGSGAVSLLDAERDLAVFWVSSAEEMPYWEKGSPLRSILHWWLARNERQLVHGAAVGNSRGAVLIGGKGGSGKSTTALACIESDLLYLGDDYTVLRSEPFAMVYSLYNSAKINADNVERLPHLGAKISNPDRLDSEKALLFVHEHYPAKTVAELPIRAILLPRVTGLRETRLKKTPTAQALAALAPSTIFQLPRAGAEAFKFLAAIAKQVPGYTFEVGTDLSGIPTAIEGLLAEVS
jgi:hypothetical protein